MKVVLTDYSYDHITSFVKVFEENRINFEAYQCKSTEEIIAVTKHADGVLTHFADINATVIENLEQCKIIARSAIGLDNIDVKFATSRNIPVANVPRYCLADVSNHVLMFVLALNKKLLPLNSSVQEGRWEYAISKPLHRLEGQIFGLWGFGDIAREVARKIKVFGCKVIAYDPYITKKLVPDNVEMVSLETLLSASNYISIHVPLTQSTSGMLNLDLFKKMQKKPILINTARGGVLVENDLIFALENNLISGAGLDVLTSETIDKNNPLLKFDNVLITPHSAWYSEESIEELQTTAAETVCKILLGKKAEGIVNWEQISLGTSKINNC